MSQDTINPPGETTETPANPPVVVKKYANRRLYNTESSSYVTLDDLATMVRQGRNFVVYDAKSGEDITRSVLTQIIVEEEAKGRNLLPTSFLRQIIGFYGDSMQSLVPRYLESVMGAFARQHDQMRRAMEQTMGGMGGMGSFNPFGSLEEMSLFAPFRPGSAEPEPTGDAARIAALQAEVDRLKAELAAARAPASRPKG
jgi:polyhydroxyalkanoate synthesis repressor PhaR